MRNYWVICEDIRGFGPGYSFYTPQEAIEMAKKIEHQYATVDVYVDTGVSSLKIWSKRGKAHDKS